MTLFIKHRVYIFLVRLDLMFSMSSFLITMFNTMLLSNPTKDTYHLSLVNKVIQKYLDHKFLHLQLI